MRFTKRRIAPAFFAVCVATAGLGIPAGSPAEAKELFAESFTRATANSPAWKAISTEGKYDPCLTAAPAATTGTLPACHRVTDGSAQPDAEGTGAFELSSNAENEAGALLLDEALDADQGLHIEFDMFQYQAKPYKDRGGDGISFFLLDGAQGGIKPGASGGGLGYKGVDGAIVGLGFDEYGNFSTKSDKEFSTGPGLRPDSVVLRGAQSTDYKYLAGLESPAPLAVGKATDRDSARRTVNIDLSTGNLLSVYIDFHDGKGKRKVLTKVDLGKFDGQPELPPTIKLGFAASTGLATATHEIQGFKASSLDPDLAIALSAPGTFKQGGTGVLEAKVRNDETAGPTTGPVTTTFTVPDGLTPREAAGDGWKCTIAGQLVTCTQPAVLRPGDSYPPIKVNSDVAYDAPASLTAKATTDTAREHKPADNTAERSIAIAKNPPDVSVKVTPAGPFSKGGTGVITAVATDDPEAGPSAGPTKITVPAPPGTTVKSAEGEGWNCSVTASLATCERPGVLEPGKSFPPVNVTVAIPPNAPDDLTVEAGVEVPDDADEENDKDTTTVPVRPMPPDLAVVIQPSGSFVAGGGGTLTTTVSNAGAAGPTAGKVSVDMPVPNGVMVTAASGQGWSCAPAQDVVTCYRAGTGGDALQPGTRYPPIVVTTKAAPATVSATVTTPGDSDTSNNSVQTTQRWGGYAP